MPDSATSVREQRQLQTARSLRETARTLTIDRGLTGFTIEELCSEVGVSRRTFFNYFASKENAVLGVPVRTPEDAELSDRFLAGEGDLLDDAIELLVGRWRLLGIEPAEMQEIGRAFEREPRLLPHFLELMTAGEKADTALIEQREGWDAGDVRASTAVHVLGALLRPTLDDCLRNGAVSDIPTLLRARLATARALLTL